MNIKNKKFWVVGSSEGIGREACLALAGEGGVVYASSRSEDKLKALVEEIGDGVSEYFGFDVTDYEKAAQVFEKVKGNDFDVFFYNAGIYDPISAIDINVEKAEYANRMIDINLKGFINLLGLVVPYFKAKGGGRIIVTASVAGFVGLPKASAYGASKAALINYAESLKLELDAHNITVQVVNPGFVESRLTDKNEFEMPMKISAEEAGREILKGIQQDDFEIHFPKGFTLIMKFLKLLPYWAFFPLLRKAIK